MWVTVISSGYKDGQNLGGHEVDNKGNKTVDTSISISFPLDNHNYEVKATTKTQTP